MKDFLQRLFGGAPSEPPASPPHAPREPEAPSLDWKAEMAFELGLAANASAPPPARPVSASVAGPKQYSRAAGFKPEMVPADLDSYRALMHRVFDPPKARLARALAAEPRIEAAWRVWRPGDEAANLNVLHEVFERTSRLMGEIYRFHPAPLGYDPAMDASAVGEYSHVHRRVMLSRRLLHDPVTELFATVVHEQIHKLQHEMTLRLDFPSPWPLSLEERALAYYWIRERPKQVVGYSRSPAYRDLGVEAHAFDTEEFVVAALRRAFRR